MTSQEMAFFEMWLECYATPGERALSFDDQLMCHIQWLSSMVTAGEILEKMPTEDVQ